VSQHPLARDLRNVLARTEPLWSEMRQQSVFITGGTGFVGRWMLESLLWATDQLALNVRVVVLSRRPEAFARAAPHLAGDPAVTFLRGDVRAFPYPDGEYPHVLHLAKEPVPAADVGSGTATPATLAPGTDRVLAFAASHGTKKLLFTSSGAVYGRQPEGCERLEEDRPGVISPQDPHAGYALGKQAAERLCLSASRHSDVNVKIARCFTFVGPYMDFAAGFAIGDFIRDAACGDPLRVTGDGTPLRSYLYAADLAVWLWTIHCAGANAWPYNVGSPDAVSIADTARLVARVAGRDKAVRIAQSPSPGLATPTRYVPDTSRAASHLGLKVEIGLEEAVRRTLDWYRPGRCGRS